MWSGPGMSAAVLNIPPLLLRSEWIRSRRFQLQMRSGCEWRPSGKRHAHGWLSPLCAGSLTTCLRCPYRQTDRQKGRVCGQSCGQTRTCSAAPSTLEITARQPPVVPTGGRWRSPPLTHSALAYCCVQVLLVNCCFFWFPKKYK